jgi:hypothetical protein
MSDTNNDDLQNAINGIVNGDTPDLGTAPVPPTSGDGAPDLSFPTTDSTDPIASLMNPEPTAIEKPTETTADVPAETPAETESEETPLTPIVENTPAAMSDLKKSMISDLIPLMDKVSLPAEKQFGFYREVIDTTNNKDLVADAYKAAKQIADDKERAEALLYLIDVSE